jgi:CRP/FNR family cyclic AMP-dependent transcriptional regulator
MPLAAHIDHAERFVYVLDHDAGLRSVLAEPDRSRARQHAVAAIADLPPGPWDPADGPTAEVGLLVLRGLLIREVQVPEARCGELIGPGTLLRPLDDTSAGASMHHEVVWHVVEPVRLALLDQHFLRVAAHWPALTTALVARATERTHDLAVMMSIHSLKRVDARLLAFFWHLADRHGKVTADGVLIPLPLTHRQLALVVGAQRPSVTSALGQLTDRGVLHRDATGRWVLAGDQAGELASLGGVA